MGWRAMLLTSTTCFLLGTTFTHWIADHNVLWRTPLTEDAVKTSIQYYSLLHSAQQGYLGWAYLFVGCLAIAAAGGRMLKGLTMGEGGEVLFDGGSLVLLAAITLNQAMDVFPTISIIPTPMPENIQNHPTYPALTTAVRDLANDNVMSSVMLTGVMLLQAGRYYSQRPSSQSPDQSPEGTPARTPILLPAPESPSRVKQRVGTPYRELSESETLGGSSSEEPRKTRARRTNRKKLA